MNPFEKLGVDVTADKADITAAYRIKAKACHPDVHPGDPDAQRRFVELGQAYEAALASLEARKKQQTARPAATSRAKPRRDVRREAFITVEQAVRGCTVRFDGMAGPCASCGGEGSIRSRHVHPCDTCGGSGISGYRERGIIRVKIGCPDCGGSGRSTRLRCAECGGTGTLPGTGACVDLPPGVNDGEVFTVRGGADDPATGTRGDLEVVVRVQDSGGFRMVRGDVETDLEVELWEAALGCVRVVVSPDGRRFRLQVPPGSRHGRRFRLKGQTLADGRRRDFVVVLSLRVPDASEGRVRHAFEALRDALR